MIDKKYSKLTKKELIEEINKLKGNKETKPKETIEIKNRYTDEVIYESETAKTVKEAVEEAVEKEVSLSKADLSEADLSEANLTRANLSEADLSRADLTFCKMDKKVFKQITEEWFEWEIID